MNEEDKPLGFIRNTKAGGHYFRDVIDGKRFTNTEWGNLKIEQNPTLQGAEFLEVSEVSIPKEFI